MRFKRSKQNRDDHPKRENLPGIPLETQLLLQALEQGKIAQPRPMPPPRRH